jgi:uncharacterized protein (DUF2147 family)
MKTPILFFAVTAIITLTFSTHAHAQKNQLEKVWYDEAKTSKVEIYLGKDGKFYGKIIWLSEPIDKKTGKPQTDTENPDPKLRNTPVQGLVILNSFVPDKDDKNIYTGGTVYDPDSGKTYCGKITFKGTKLDMRGYICSFSLFGRTETWTEAGSSN